MALSKGFKVKKNTTSVGGCAFSCNMIGLCKLVTPLSKEPFASFWFPAATLLLSRASQPRHNKSRSRLESGEVFIELTGSLNDS